LKSSFFSGKSLENPLEIDLFDASEAATKRLSPRRPLRLAPGQVRPGEHEELKKGETTAVSEMGLKWS
jgi:hypothetical protein